jgi:hypothetical protein
LPCLPGRKSGHSAIEKRVPSSALATWSMSRSAPPRAIETVLELNSIQTLDTSMSSPLATAACTASGQLVPHVMPETLKEAQSLINDHQHIDNAALKRSK